MSNNEDRKNRAYTERAIVVKLLLAQAEKLGYEYGWGQDDNADWEPEWRRVVYIDLPEGQVSWHVSPDDWHMFDGIKPYGKKWDGTFNSREASFAKAIPFTKYTIDWMQ